MTSLQIPDFARHEPKRGTARRRAPAAWRRPGHCTTDRTFMESNRLSTRNQRIDDRKAISHVLIALICILAAAMPAAQAQTSTPAVKDKSILSQVRFEQRLD